MRDKTYFISDAHLGATYIRDRRAHEHALTMMLDVMAEDARTIYLLGDMLDFWFEYRHVVPKGFTRFFGRLAQLTDNGVEVVWFKGNHDMWTQGYLTEELGVRIVSEELITDIGGSRFFIAHGDGVGRLPRAYRLLRSVFRNEFCRRIGAAIHPRWLMGFGLAWSAHNRMKRSDCPLRLPSGTTSSFLPEEGKTPEAGAGIPDEVLAESGRHENDVERRDEEQQMNFVMEYSREHPDIDYFIFGHRHEAVDVPVPGSHARYICLGDFFKLFTYAVFDGKKLSLKQFAIPK